jgi:hypothetical protein
MEMSKNRIWKRYSNKPGLEVDGLERVLQLGKQFLEENANEDGAVGLLNQSRILHQAREHLSRKEFDVFRQLVGFPPSGVPGLITDEESFLHRVEVFRSQLGENLEKWAVIYLVSSMTNDAEIESFFNEYRKVSTRNTAEILVHFSQRKARTSGPDDQEVRG